MYEVKILCCPNKTDLTKEEYAFLKGHLGCHEEPEWNTFMLITADDGTKCYVQGGEPEDQTFSRDLSWIEKELYRAYNQGGCDGIASSTSGYWSTNE